MIHDVDESLRSLIRLRMESETAVEIVFDAPTRDWASRRNAPTVDLYLYDIREDADRRQVGQIERRSDDGRRIAGWGSPPRWFKLSYLLTAWTQRPEDEHRLLSMLLAAFLAQDGIPVEALAGSLSGAGSPIAYTVALPPPKDRALSDTWSALGGELKPSLDLVVTAPFDLGRFDEAGPPVAEPLHIGLIDKTVERGDAAYDPPRMIRRFDRRGAASTSRPELP
ncbi:MAG TPA: DUF4255 domain-containing protein [Microthrixaceae bacterium]|nr:DUF4255 domain-containing protein [Microthrixaceae bacterium]HNI35482.1 DUF4255 domain-containing protein [Microthrixaceae bacterium]